MRKKAVLCTVLVLAALFPAAGAAAKEPQTSSGPVNARSDATTPRSSSHVLAPSDRVRVARRGRRLRRR